MKVRPRVLVFDDLIGMERPSAFDIQNRADYCRTLGLRDEATPEDSSYTVVADSVISSGQIATPDGPANDLGEVERAFRMGWPSAAGRFWSAVLVDMKFGEDTHFGLRIIDLLHRLASDLPIIVVSSLNQLQLRAGETLRHAAERLGAQDFLAISGVDFDVEPSHRSTPENMLARLDALGLMPDPEQHVVGTSLPVCRMLREIRSLIPQDVVGQILLLGEAGAGKSHLLRYVHDHVARTQGRPTSRVRVQSITLAGTGEEMQSKALFGTTAATGVRETPGAFQDVSDGGLLFLDEIGELTATSQSDLLGALQPLQDADGARYRDVRRMGAREGIRSRCLVLAATNRDLQRMVDQGQFNEALLQRFANRQVYVPSLRERKTDLPLLVDRFVDNAIRQYNVPVRPKLEVPQSTWEAYAETHAIRQLATLIEGTISRKRFKTLLTEQDFFGTPDGTRVTPDPRSRKSDSREDTPEVPPPSSTTAHSSVSDLYSKIESWSPVPSMDPAEYDEAFVRLDRAFARAKLRLWRSVVDQQKKLTGSINLLATARQLLGRPDIVNSKSGDLAAKIFTEANIRELPDDPILAEIWLRRRVTRRSESKDSSVT